MLAALMARRAGSDRGFTLVEVTIILLVLVILSTIMLPQLGNFNRLARYVKVREDLGAICATMKKFLDEVQLPGPFDLPGGACTTDDTAACTSVEEGAAPVGPVGLLVGPGTPAADAANTPDPGVSEGTWALLTSAVFDETPDLLAGVGVATATEFTVDTLDEHLQYNRATGLVSTVRYRNQKDDPTVGAFLGWRGPYFDTITPDAWGGRYMVNTFGLHRDVEGNGFSTAVVCFSAGPNINAETLFNQPHPAQYTVGGDDLAVVLSSFGPF